MTARQAANREARSWVHHLIATRNRLAHAGSEDMSDANARWALDTVISHLEPVDAQAVEPLWALAQAVRYGTSGALPSKRSLAETVTPRRRCAVALVRNQTG